MDDKTWNKVMDETIAIIKDQMEDINDDLIQDFGKHLIEVFKMKKTTFPDNLDKLKDVSVKDINMFTSVFNTLNKKEAKKLLNTPMHSTSLPPEFAALFAMHNCNPQPTTIDKPRIKVKRKLPKDWKIIK